MNRRNDNKLRGEKMSVIKLGNNEKIKFNSLYIKATNLLNGKIDCYKLLSTLDKIKIMEAIALFKECINIYPFSWQSHWAIGKAYQAIEEQNMALEWFEMAKKIDNFNVNILRECTLQSLRLGLKEQAIEYAKAALELDFNNDGLHSNYALALLINKKGKEALLEINKALSINGNNQINKNIFNLIKAILDGKKTYPNKID